MGPWDWFLALCRLGRRGSFWWITARQRELGNNPENDFAFFQSECKRYSYELVDQVAQQTDRASLGRWYSKDKDPLSPQHWFRGRIVLLGDACHAANPFSGYGAGMTIEDAYWLAHFLDTPNILVPTHQSANLEKALIRYRNKRAKYTATIVHESRTLMKTLHPPNCVLAGIINGIWRSGMLGPVIARKFFNVFKVGLDETQWTDQEKANGALML